MYEIEHLNYKIEQRDREIQYLIKCVEKSNTELVNIKKRIHDNGQYVLVDVLKLAKSIHDYNQNEDYVNIIETITNYVRLFECCEATRKAPTASFECSKNINIDTIQNADGVLLSSTIQQPVDLSKHGTCSIVSNDTNVNLSHTPIDYNRLTQDVFNNKEYILCNIKKLTNCIYEYNKELDFADIENIIIDNRLSINEIVHL